MSLLLSGLAACRPNEVELEPGEDLARLQPVQFEDRKPRVVATTNFIADLVRQIGADRIELTGLLGPGVDPHLYKASAGDARRIANADLVLYGGLHLEGKMVELFERSTNAVAVSTLMPRQRLHRSTNFANQFDPHVWFDVSLWTYAARAVEAALVKLDPEHADGYKTNAQAYVLRLEELDRWVKKMIANIPASSRVLITAHDAFGYFGARYGIEVRGLQGISTASEAGTRDVQLLAEFIAERYIPAIFVESSVPRRTLEAVRAAVRARGRTLEIGGELFSDAAGAEGTVEGTYIGMVEHNVQTIVRALTGGS